MAALVTALFAGQFAMVGGLALPDAQSIGTWRANEDDATRFVELWAPRILDNEWFNAYVDADTTPKDILAEGWPQVDARDRQMLMDRLFDHFLAKVPEFRAEMEALGGDRPERLQEMKAVMGGFIFDKDGLRQGLKDAATAAEEVPTIVGPTGDADQLNAHLVNEVPLTVEPLEPTPITVESPHPIIIEGPSVTAAPVVVEPVGDVTPIVPEFVATPDFPFPTEEAGQGHVLDVMAMPSIEGLDLPAHVVVAKPAPAVQASLPGLPSPEVDPPTTPAAIQAFAKAISYTACGKVGASGTVRCFAQAVPFGVPVGLDLDGSPTTGIGGIDAIVHVIPMVVPGALAWAPPGSPPMPFGPVPSSPTALPGYLQGAATQLQNNAKDGLTPGIGVTLRVQVLPNPGQTSRQLGASVWVVYGIADPNTGATDKLIRVGVDGTEAGSFLPEVSGITAKINSLPALLAKRVLASLELNFQKPAPHVQVFASFNEMNGAGQPVDPMTATIRMEPVPNIKVDVDAQMDGSRMTGVLTSTVQTKLTLKLEAQKTSPASTTIAQVTLDKLPTRVQVDYERLADGTRIEYDASSVIGTITGSFQRVDSETTAGTVVITNLPSNIEVFFRAGSSKGNVEYRASGIIPLVTGTFSRVGSQGTTTGTFSVANIPARITVSWDMGISPQVITYDASSSLGPISFTLSNGPGKLAFAGTITSLPPWMQVRMLSDFYEFDARTGPTGGVGSAAIGSIVLGVGTDGILITAGLPADDHLYVQQPSPTVTRAALKYTGLSYAKADLRNDQVHAEVRNSQPRLFKMSVDTPQAIITGTIDKIPQRVSIDIVGETYTYNAHGQTINQILIGFNNKATPPLTATVDIRGIPSLMTMTLDLDGKQILYSASTPITSIAISASVPTPSLGTFTLSLTITSIPTSFSVKFPDGTFVYDSPTGIGSISLFVSNNAPGGPIMLFPCGTVSIFPLVVVPNNFCATVNAITQKFRVELNLVSVKHVEFRELQKGVLLDIGVGGGQRFVGNVDATLPRSGFFGALSQSDRALLSFDINPLPSSIRLETGELIKYTANANFDLSIDATYGANEAVSNNAVPAPPVYALGVSVRDGSYSSCNGVICFFIGSAVKAAVRITGVPTSIEAGTKDFGGGVRGPYFSATNWRPKTSVLTMDVELDNIVPTAIDALITQSGLPTTQAVNLGFSMTETQQADKSKRMNITAGAAPGLGAFDADIKFGPHAGRLQISNIPASINTVVVLGKDTKTVTNTMSQGISRIFAGFKVNLADASFGAGLELLNIPATISLSFGKVTITPASGETYTAPGMTYSASASTLDINAYVNAAMSNVLGGDLTAVVTLNVADLGASVTTTFTSSSRTLQITSSPATTNFEIHVWAQYRVMKSFNGCFPSNCPWLRVQWNGHAGIVPLTINDLMVKLTSFSSFTLKVGISSSIQGSYGTFTFGWNTISVTVDVGIKVEAVADFGALGSVDPDIINWNYFNTLYLNILWHVAGNHMSSDSSFFHYDTPGIACGCDWGGCSDYDIHVDIKPHPHFASWNSFSVSQASSGEGSAWIVTPDPWDIIPDKAIHAAAALLSPLGGGFDISAPCH